MSFKLHPVLANDCIVIGEFQLSQVLLMNDEHYPWVILVPMVAEISEVFELSQSQQTILAEESTFVLKAMSETFKADKMNQAALGNMVPQLHIHHVARFHDDAAWPAPIWGKVTPKKYSEQALQQMVADLHKAFSHHSSYQPL
ncbi:HIT domain-containing protein [Kangiella sediminilitoris]|uniref:Histidine triad (HIT) protein n=1 Tax=Kangiella sediminilitoris TaxID=1144748 RepID=A0A1B3BDA7_9GAMM|nr:HIT domain-containing protein [Kangiella sediminilitoris]AOE50748.1 histidine triad (HIT) protein [Kangiella sediminilitoris]